MREGLRIQRPYNARDVEVQETNQTAGHAGDPRIAAIAVHELE